MIKGLLFWGYVDDQGIVSVKYYTNDRVIEQMERMPWCRGIFDPFEAYTMDEAKQKCIAKYRELN